jgi:hypothetical protein
MNIVLASTKIDSKIKHRILNVLLFTEKNAIRSWFREAVSYFETDKSVAVAKEIGSFSR